MVEGAVADSFAALNASSCSCRSASNVSDTEDKDYEQVEYAEPKKPTVSIKQKAKILKLIGDHPNWSFRTFKSKYPCFKHPNYRTKWADQIKNGGTQAEVFYEIHKYVLDKFCEARAQFKPIHDITIRRWALERASEFPGVRQQFSASSRWVQYFKNKHHITSRKVTKVVSKRNIRSMEEIVASVENFRAEIQQLQPSYDLANIWNTDQIGFNYEYIDTRTLSWTGEKITLGAGFSPTNKATHSYTVQYIISASGEIIGPAFVCLQEQTGRLGDQVQARLFSAPNLCITCTKSGKLNKSQVKYFFENVAKPFIFGRILYILDSWGCHIQCDAYNDLGEGNDLLVKVIPKNGTSIGQPLDVYFNRELKYFVKRVSSYANLHDYEITSRNDILRVQCLAHFTFSAPVFKEMIKYSWKKSGLVNIERQYFDNVRDVCFNFPEKECEDQQCSEDAFYKCSWCGKVICFHHFFDDVHALQCEKGPLV